jgi:hypothetical protein
MGLQKNLSRRSMLQLGVVGGVGVLGGDADGGHTRRPQVRNANPDRRPFYPKRAQLDPDT